jgi:hypothetical protein
MGEGKRRAMRRDEYVHVDLVRDLIPATEKELFPHGKPKGW